MTEQQSKYVANAEQKKKPPPLPPEIINTFCDKEQSITQSQFDYGYLLLDTLDELQPAYAGWYESEGYSEAQAMRKAHAYLVNSIAGHSGVSRSEMSKRENVCKDVTPDMHEEYPALTFSHWEEMRRGAQEDTAQNVRDNLEWVTNIMDMRGGVPPSTTEIRERIDGTYDMPLWKKRVRRLFNALRAVLDTDDVPLEIRQGSELLLDAIKAIAKKINLKLEKEGENE